MRYSKKKKITIAIISFVCVLFLGIILYKGISDSMKLTDNTGDEVSNPKVSANVGFFTKIKNKITKNKDDEKEENTKIKINKKKTVKKEENKEEKKEEVTEEELDDNLTGTYTVTELKIGDKKYTKDELKKLKENGYSLSLELNKNRVANVSVLYINELYEYDNEYFDNGVDRIKYNRSGKKIKIKIKDAEITFKKE